MEVDSDSDDEPPETDLLAGSLLGSILSKRPKAATGGGAQAPKSTGTPKVVAVNSRAPKAAAAPAKVVVPLPLPITPSKRPLENAAAADESDAQGEGSKRKGRPPRHTTAEDMLRPEGFFENRQMFEGLVNDLCDDQFMKYFVSNEVIANLATNLKTKQKTVDGCHEQVVKIERKLAKRSNAKDLIGDDIITEKKKFKSLSFLCIEHGKKKRDYSKLREVLLTMRQNGVKAPNCVKTEVLIHTLVTLGQFKQYDQLKAIMTSWVIDDDNFFQASSNSDKERVCSEVIELTVPRIFQICSNGDEPKAIEAMTETKVFCTVFLQERCVTPACERHIKDSEDTETPLPPHRCKLFALPFPFSRSDAMCPRMPTCQCIQIFLYSDSFDT